MTRPTLPQGTGRGAEGGGWSQPLEEVWLQLLAEMRGLRERLDGKGLQGVPAAYGGQRIFKAEEGTVTVVDPVDGSSITTHYILRDGQTYDIPIYFPGPGVFVATLLEVSIFQRMLDDTGRDDQLISRTLTTALATDASTDALLRANRWSLQGGLTNSWFLDARTQYVPMCNFFWGLSDLKSRRSLSDDLMSHMALAPMSPMQQIQLSTDLPTPSDAMGTVDGASFRFDAPWLFERDGQASFQLRPITAVYGTSQQFPAAGSTGPLSVQDVTVQVELHGERFENLQDAMRAGALTRPVRRDER